MLGCNDDGNEGLQRGQLALCFERRWTPPRSAGNSLGMEVREGSGEMVST
jgi:hypothetical protein